jgi:alkylation response protein AidB-like acyl-CoA dehydrogenase
MDGLRAGGWDDLADSVRASRKETDRAGALPPDLVEQLRSRGAFHLIVPPELGGLGLSPGEAFGAIRTLAAASGSVGWCVAQSNAANLLAGLVPTEVAATMLKDRAIVAGVLAPKGAVKVVPGGGIVSGRWPLASGCLHADVLGLGAVVSEGGAPRRQPDGSLDLHVALLPKEAVRIDHTWDSLGLRGTGSHHVEADRAPVLADRIVRLDDRSARPEPWFASPIWTVFPAIIAASAVGIADGTMDALRRCRTAPREKALMLDGGELAELGRAHARLETCVLGLLSLLESLGTTRSDDAQRVRMRGAVVVSVEAARQVVDAVFHASGASATYADSPVEANLRDILTLSQHRLLSINNYPGIGRFWLEDTELPAGY